MARVLPDGGTSAATNLGAPVNGPKDDFAFVLDNDMKGGYFSSNRDGGKGSDDIYAYDLLIPFRLTKRIEGYVMDKNNNALLLAGSTVVLKDASGNIAGTVQADDKGFYSFEAEPDQEFIIQGSNANYTGATVKASTGGNEDMVQANLQLEKIPQISLACFVSDQKSGQPLSGTHIIIRDKATGKELVNATTGADGFFKNPLENAKLSDQLSYTISLEHDGYLSKNLDFAYTITKEGEIKVHEQLDLTMGKLEIGTDIGKLIDIKPIYFDLGKSNIRTDASVELDKIVAIMKQYPTMVIELGSHTDCRSSKTSNEALSNKRAQASANYIISKGIDKSRIYGKGYGESKPVNGCVCEGAVKSDCSEEEHQKNRRTEFIVVKM
jgi:outer membrane protein OmpA-like peptidoglycan-associated protein